MNIYVNGDSYAAGTELADPVLLGFPGYNHTGSPISTEVSKEIKEWTNMKWQVGSSYYGGIDNYIKAEKSLAWPAELSKLDPNLFVNNGSKNGASMTGITHRTIADLLTYRAQGVTFDRVFIQLTSCHRFEIYDVNAPQQKFIVDKSVGWIDTLPNKTQRDLGECYVAQYKDADYAVKFLYNLCTLKQAVKGLTGTDPIILSSLFFFTNNVIDPLKHNTNPLIQTLLTESGILDIDPALCMLSVHRDNNFLYLPVSHFEHRTHIAYAKIIYDKYIKI